MKRILVLAAVFLYGLTVNAQTEKGRILLGGAIGYGTGKSKPQGQKNSDFTINPSMGYFIADHLAVGTGLGYLHHKYDQTTVYIDSYGITNIKEQGIVVNPFVRYYAQTEGQFQFFAELSVPLFFGNTREKEEGQPDYIKSGTNRNFGVALSPGMVFFPTRKIGIEFSLNGISYGNSRYEKLGTDAYRSTTNSFSLDADFFAPKIGIQYYF